MRYLIFAIALLVFPGACISPAPPETVYDYLQEGERFFEKGLFNNAIEAWEKVRESYYSPELTALAEMKIAEAHYQAKHYGEAAAIYEDFLKQHPDHQRTSQILYQLGMSYYNQILSPDRDQNATHRALATFKDLTERFPGTPETEEVNVLMSRCRNQLAAHELYVGHFYLRTNHLKAAISRLKEIFTLYPGYDEQDKAYYYLGQAHLKNGDRQKAVESFNTLTKKFPESKYAIQAKKLFEKQRI
jgi:outer membrane protein assembly factor BamD